MIRRQPKKTKPVRHFADLFGVSAKTLKKMADDKGWKKITYSDEPNATIYLLEKQVNEYFLERQENTHAR